MSTRTSNLKKRRYGHVTSGYPVTTTTTGGDKRRHATMATRSDGLRLVRWCFHLPARRYVFVIITWLSQQEHLISAVDLKVRRTSATVHPHANNADNTDAGANPRRQCIRRPFLPPTSMISSQQHISQFPAVPPTPTASATWHNHSIPTTPSALTPVVDRPKHLIAFRRRPGTVRPPCVYGLVATIRHRLWGSTDGPGPPLDRGRGFEIGRHSPRCFTGPQ